MHGLSADPHTLREKEGCFACHARHHDYVGRRRIPIICRLKRQRSFAWDRWSTTNMRTLTTTPTSITTQPTPNRIIDKYGSLNTERLSFRSVTFEKHDLAEEDHNWRAPDICPRTGVVDRHQPGSERKEKDWVNKNSSTKGRIARRPATSADPAPASRRKSATTSENTIRERTT